MADLIAGVQGLCLGIVVGAAATDASFYFIMWRTDWSLEAKKAAQRVAQPSSASLHDVSVQNESDQDNVVDSEAEVAGLLQSDADKSDSRQHEQELAQH